MVLIITSQDINKYWNITPNNCQIFNILSTLRYVKVVYVIVLMLRTAKQLYSVFQNWELMKSIRRENGGNEKLSKVNVGLYSF